MPGVRTVRSASMFGFSTIHVVFAEDVEFYWSRSRILEKLASLPAATLPPGVQPSLGPDATPLGQVFWYTLEGRAPDGTPTGGWDLQELRSAQDWIARYALASAEGISEVASVGGFVREYQIDVDPAAMRNRGVRLTDVFRAVRGSNLDVGARTVEINRVEYVVRGLGFLESLEDLEETVVHVEDGVPIRVRDVATVTLGPALRRGALDDAGAETVGGVAVVRYGYNPLQAIENLHAEIERLAPALPVKAIVDPRRVSRPELEAFARSRGFEPFERSEAGEAPASDEIDQEAWQAWLRAHDPAEWPEWATLSRVTVVPFYDRTGLIHETLATLESALIDEVLVTIVVVLVMVMSLRSAALVSAVLPLAIGLCFVLMKLFGIDANVVALSGIAIAIGTMVDLGIVVTENVLQHLDEADEGESRLEVVHRAASEVAGAVVTAVATTIVGFLPVFLMTGAEGRLFRPLAFTKTFALLASVAVALVALPPAAHLLLRRRSRPAGDAGRPTRLRWAGTTVAVAVVLVVLADHWSPLGPGAGRTRNLVFTAGLLLGVLLFFRAVRAIYPTALRWSLDHKVAVLAPTAVLLVFGACVWLGFDRVFGFVPEDGAAGRVRETVLWHRADEALPGLGKEFMPDLDEGSFLLMPSTMAHASIGEALEVLQLQDRAIASIPEVRTVVGKIGRVDSALDPAPIGMIETVIDYVPEYGVDEDGERFRLWRDHIRSPDDIWEEILLAAELPGTTSAPRLQPIAARLVMLQSGMRAPLGVKIQGADLEAIEEVGLEVERLLKDVPGVRPETVVADRIVGKPYLEIDLDREALARHGLAVGDVQEVIEVAIGGKTLTTTVEGRERYPVRVRYERELRDDVEGLERILVPTPGGAQIPLMQLAELRFARGPQAIRSEDTRLVGHVLFDREEGYAEVDVAEACDARIAAALATGELVLPPGVDRPVLAGTYENQVRAQRTLSFVLPLALLVILLILYLQFRSASLTLVVWSGILVAWSGGFLLLWLYGRAGFLDVEVLGRSLREVFQVEPRNLSVAVWVGFLALFGIATDDGVVLGTYLRQSFARRAPTTVAEIRAATVAAGSRRIRPCLMTTATTILALLPVLSSTGRGADVMVPMAIPSFGGMLVVLVTVILVPVLYCWTQEVRLRIETRRAGAVRPTPETTR